MGMCGGGDGGYANSTTSNEPWDVQADYLRDMFKSGWQGMTGYDTSGNPVGKDSKFVKMFEGDNAVGKLDYVGDANNLWGGEGLQAISDGTNKGLGSSTLKMTAAPTVGAFSPEEIAAQNIIKGRLQGFNTATTDGNRYNTGYTELIPQAKTALSNIVTGQNRINPASYSAANVSAPSTISRPNIGTPDSLIAPTIGSTDLGYNYWDELGQMAGGKQNQYLEDLITNARGNITKEYYNNTMPALDTTAEAAGRYGGNTWANMRGSAYDKYQNNLKAQETALRSSAYNTNQSNALQAMNLGGDLAKTQSGYDYGRTSDQAAMEMERRAKEYDTIAAAKQLTGQLGLQADTSQAGNELTRNVQNALLSQEANQGNAGFTQQANVQNVANVLQGAPIAPGVSQSDYADIAALAGVGEAQGAKQQDIIDAFIKRFETNQNEPNVRMANMSNLLSGNFGGETTSRAPATSSGGCF